MDTATTAPSIPKRLFVVMAAMALFVVTSISLAASAQAHPIKLSLKGDGVPVASTSPGGPPATPLPNYDSWRDADPGLSLWRSDKGFDEDQAKRHQLWLLPPEVGSVDRAGLTIWSTLRDYHDGVGVLNAYFVDCDAGGSSCVLLSSTQITDAHWSGAGTWVPHTVDFGAASVGAGRRLGIKLVVDQASERRMWFAYGVVDFPAFVAVGGAGGGGATATTTTSTTTTSTTTTVPPVTTATSTTLPDTTTTTLPDTPTTTVPKTTTTTVPKTTTTTSTTVPSSPSTTVPEIATTTTPSAGGSSKPPTTNPPTVLPAPTETARPEEAQEANPQEETDTDDEVAIVAANGGADPGGGDVLLAALAVPQAEATEAPVTPATASAPIAGRFVEGSSGVIPPAVAEVLFSPLMIFELLIRAITDTGKAILLPALLMALASSALIFRGFGAPSRRSPQGA